MNDPKDPKNFMKALIGGGSPLGINEFQREFLENAGLRVPPAKMPWERVEDPEPEKTVVERAKDMLEEMADHLETYDGKPDPRADECREIAEGLLAADQYDAVVIVLARLSGKPKRLVKRVLKSKLNVTG